MIVARLSDLLLLDCHLELGCDMLDVAQESTQRNCLWFARRRSMLVAAVVSLWAYHSDQCCKQVCLGLVRSNKSFTLNAADSPVVSCCASVDSDVFLAGHEDGTVYRYTFPDPEAQRPPSKVRLVSNTMFVHHWLTTFTPRRRLLYDVALRHTVWPGASILLWLVTVQLCNSTPNREPLCKSATTVTRTK